MKRLFYLTKLSFRFCGLFPPLSLSSFLSVLSLILGVSTLILSLVLVDSYEKAFKEGIFSAFSHANVMLLDPESSPEMDKVHDDISSIYNKPFQLSPISKKEALLAHDGKVSGAALIGVERESILDVIPLNTKVVEGEFLEASDSEVDEAVIGQGLQQNFNLKVGDVFSIVVPFRDYNYSKSFKRKVLKARVKGVIDFGTHEYNKRFILVSRSVVNTLIDKPENYFSEFRLRLSDDQDVFSLKEKFLDEFAAEYWVRTWDEESGGLLEAIKIEKMVIFFLVLIMVVVAAFNVSTNLFLNLSKRQKDFAVLRTLGLKKKDIMYILVFNGFILALVGIFIGTCFAYMIASLLNTILEAGLFIPPEVYKLTSIVLSIKVYQLVVVALSTVFLCLIAALAPALGILNQSIVEGVKYE